MKYIVIPEKELSNHEDRFGELLDKSHQEVKGKYINDEKFDKFLFEDKLGFLTSEEAESEALLYTLKHLI